MQRSPNPKAPSISWVTVVYRAELGLLQLQARSMAKFLPADAALEIIVILNDPNPKRLATEVLKIAQDFGPHQPKLRLVDPTEIFLGPQGLRDAKNAILALARRVLRPVRIGRGSSWRGYAGWHIQQAMKLAVSRNVKGDAIVFLDAKNHFIAPVSLNDFVTRTGQPRARLERVQDNYFDWHRTARAYLGLDQVERDHPLPPSITPFVSKTETVRDTLAWIEKEDGPMEYFFGNGTPRGTEFTLIAAMTEKRDETLTSDIVRFGSFFRDATDEEVSELIEKARSGSLQMLGTHSGRLTKMTPEQCTPLFDLWIDIGLTVDRDEAALLLKGGR